MTSDEHREHREHDPVLRAPVRTQADLERLWRALMGPLGFSCSSLWLLRLEPDGRPIPRLTKIDDVDELPDTDQQAGLVSTLRELSGDRSDDAAGDGGRWAFLISRPGAGGATRFDRDLANLLVGLCRAGGVRTEVVHLATDEELWPLPYDVLVRSA